MPDTARVLIADPDPVHRAVMVELLDLAGFDCEAAEDGEAALQALARRPADLVILEMLMPDKDGIEVLIHVKREQPAARVMTVSAGGLMSPAQLLRLSKGLGADATMAKPLRRGAFVATVRRLLDRADEAAA